MYKIAILSSTGGTNLQSFIDARDAGQLKGIQICCLLSNKTNCGAVERAKKAGIPIHIVESKGKSREEYDRQVMEALEPYHLDLIVLGGYMRIIGPKMIHRYKNKIINIHPSLLPKFAGGMNLSVHQAVLDAGEKETGMTIHYVDEGVDTGEILLQKKVTVDSTDTAESLKAKVQVLEKEWYPKAVLNLAQKVSSPQQNAVPTSAYWDPEFVWRQHAHRSLWQHPLWATFQQAAGRKTFFLSTDKAQALLIRHALPMGLCYLEIPRGPLFGSESDLSELMEKITTLAKEEKAIFVRISAYNELPLDIGHWTLDIAKNDHHPETSLILDLSQSDEEILAQMKPKGRYNIKVAQKHGVEVRASDDVGAFHKILLQTGGRDGFGIHPQKYYEKMLQSLGENAQLLMAYHEGEPVAGGIFVYLEEWGIYYYGASDHAHRPLMAPYLIQWVAIQEAKKRGCQFYDFLGISPEGAPNHAWAGVTDFKKKFGGRVVNYPQAVELTIHPFFHWLYRLRQRLR